MITRENKFSAWFCVRAQPKHEHIASAHLRQMSDVVVFLPRIRFKRATQRGAVWATEALFPGYFFARFDLQISLRQVQSARGVRGVVHFGGRWPAVPDNIIEELQQVIGGAELHTIEAELSPGDGVQIVDGALRGLHAVISHVMPGRERVAVLMEFLGRQAIVELSVNAVVREGNERARL